MIYSGDVQMPDWQNYRRPDIVAPGNQKQWGGQLPNKLKNCI